MERQTIDYFDIIFQLIAEKGWVYDSEVNNSENKNSSAYLEAMFKNDSYFITQARELDGYGKYQYQMQQAVNVSKFYQVRDEDAENVALSEYEVKKTEINKKEKQIDEKMNMLETEQEVINTELESVKKVRNENISKTFKIFA